MTVLYHSITCTETECDQPRTVSYEVRRGEKVLRTVFVRLAGCAVREQWNRDMAVAEVADEILDPIETMLREVIMEDRSIPDARNDAAEAIVRALIGSGRMRHPADVHG